MHNKFLPLIAAWLFVVCAPAQTPVDRTLDQTLRFVNAPSDQTVNEMARVLKYVAGVTPQEPVEAASGTLLVRGTEEQIKVAGWLMKQLDVAHGTATTQKIDAGRGQTAEVFILPEAATPQSVQEIETTLRLVTSIRRFASYGWHSIAIEGANDQVALAEWLIPRLLQSTESEPLTYHLPATGEIVRVFYFTNPMTPREYVELIGAIRKTARIQSLFLCYQGKALAVRGTVEQLAAAEALVVERSASKDPRAANSH